MTDERDETARQAAHKLLDLMTAFDPDVGQISPVAYELLLGELLEIGAVGAKSTEDENNDLVTTLDIGPLLGATGFLLGLFLNYLEEHRGLDRLEIISALRETVNSGMGPG